MKSRRCLTLLVLFLFFFSLLPPPVSAAKAGDALIRIFHKDVWPPEDLLPDDVRVAAEFAPGDTDRVGRFRKVRGSVLVVHPNTAVAYPVEKRGSVHTGDTIVTGEESSVQIRLNDKSIVALAAFSKIVIDQSVYDPEQESRTSLLSMLFGKARFLVTKLVHGRKEDFKVRTPTAVCGIRGSDFALSVVPDDALTTGRLDFIKKLAFVGTAYATSGQIPIVTTLLTGKETTVSFTANTGQTQILGAFQVSRAVTGMAATAPLPVTAGLAAGVLGTFGSVGGGMSSTAIIGLGLLAGTGAGAGIYAASNSSDNGGGGGGGGLPGGTGEVQVTLQWSGCNDLDLLVTDPCGNTIDWKNQYARCGGYTGRMDLDANYPYNPDCSSTAPAENIYWNIDAIPAPGSVFTFTVEVRYIKGEGPSAFQLTLISSGARTDKTGTVSKDNDRFTTSVVVNY